MTGAIEVVQFQGDMIQAVRGEGEKIWVVVKRLCESLEIDETRQRKKLSEKPWAVTGLMSATALDGKTYETFCLALDSLPMWLATIEPSRANPKSRDKLIAYQRECADVLRDHFFGRKARLSELEPMVEKVAVAAVGRVVEAVLPRIHSLEQRVSWVERVVPTAVHGQISAHGHSCIKGYVGQLAELECLLGRWRSRGAARTGIYRALGEHVNWGGEAKCWEFLPLHLEQVALAFLRARLRAAERMVGERPQRQLEALWRDDAEPNDDAGSKRTH